MPVISFNAANRNWGLTGSNVHLLFGVKVANAEVRKEILTRNVPHVSSAISSIRLKLFAITTIAAVAVGGLTIYALNALNQSKNTIEWVVNESQSGVTMALQAKAEFEASARHISIFMATGDGKESEAFEKRVAILEQLAMIMDALGLVNSESIFRELESAIADLQQLKASVEQDEKQTSELATSLGSIVRRAGVLLDTIGSEIITSSDASAAEVRETLEQQRTLMMTACGITIALIIILSLLVANLTMRAIKRSVSAAQSVAAGELDTPVLTQDSSELGAVLVAIESMREALRQARDSQQQLFASEQNRLQGALRSASSKLVVTDPNGEILFLNDAAQTMFRDHSAAFSGSGFNASQPLGQSIRALSPTIAKAVEQATNLTDQLAVGSYRFDLAANPINSEQHNLIGFVFEFVERTAEILFQSDMEKLIDRARLGDLEHRLDTSTLQGSSATLGVGMNELLSVNNSVIGDLSGFIAALEHGNLGWRLHSEYQGTFGTLVNKANDGIAKLDEVVGKVREIAHDIGSDAGEISTGAESLRVHTETQVRHVTTTQENVKELGTAVNGTAHLASTVGEHASAAQQLAQQGLDVVGRAAEAMEGITEASKRIGSILSLINEIAFQTNLLALNAAVEAARAGEHGRGFAVVASEVRNLAGRSADAARDIKTLVDDTQQRVDLGAELVLESGSRLDAITRSVHQVRDAVDDITTASADQQQRLQLVHGAMSEIDHATQQQVTLAGRSVDSTVSIAKQLDDLLNMLKFFENESTLAAGFRRAA